MPSLYDYGRSSAAAHYSLSALDLISFDVANLYPMHKSGVRNCVGIPGELLVGKTDTNIGSYSCAMDMFYALKRTESISRIHKAHSAKIIGTDSWVG